MGTTKKKPGPKKKPTGLKLLQGTHRKDRGNSKEPQLEAEIPPEPKWLSPNGKKQWKLLGPVLAEMGVLTKADALALEQLCELYSEYLELRDSLWKPNPPNKGKKYTTTYESVTDKGGKVYKEYPQVKTIADLRKQIISILTEFGLTPASRSNVSMLPGSKKKNPFSDI